MITILAAACLAVPQDARLDRIPFQPSSTGPAALGGLVSVAPQAQQDGAFLGVGLGSEGEARIATVSPRSAAAAAGLEVGDVIVSIDGNAIGAGADVSAALAQLAPGDSVSIVARRGDEEFSRDVILGRRPQSAAGGALAPRPMFERNPSGAAPAAPSAPLRLAPRETQERAPGFLGIMATPSEEGVAIESVNPGGPAEGAGLLEGDVLLAIDGRSIGSVDELVATLGELGAGRSVEALIVRDGEELVVPIVLGGRPGRAESVELDELAPGGGFLFGGDGADLDLFGGDFLIVEEDGDGGPGSGVGGRAATDEQREMLREFRTRMQELRERHLAEMQELRAEMEEMFEAHGIAPRIQRLRERRAPAAGDLFGGDGSQRFRFFDDGQLFDLDVPPQGGAAPRMQFRRAPQGLQPVPAAPAQPAQPGQPRIQFHGGLPGSQGQQQIIEVEVLPDGKRIERRRRAELHDGEWMWVEESVDEHPAGAPGMGGMNHDAELQRTLQELRAQIDQLERRAAELRAQHGGR
jgi:membrane-associated protease RseP (regulator of RpoE activity)